MTWWGNPEGVATSMFVYVQDLPLKKSENNIMDDIYINSSNQS